MRILFATGTPGGYMAPPVLAEEQIICGPEWADDRGADGRWRSLRTPLGLYDVQAVLERLGAEQAPDVLVCLVDASWRNLPRNLSGFHGPKILLVADTHHMTQPITQMLRYATSEPFDRIVFLYDRHHVPIFRGAGLNNLYWFPGLTFPHDDDTVRSAHSTRRSAHVAFVGQAGRFHPRRSRLLEALRDGRVPLVQKQLSQRDGLKFYGSSLIGFNASLNGDLNLRVFEILASGSMLLTDRLAPASGLFDVWQEQRELVTYGNAAELTERARYYLDHPAEAVVIGRAGAKWFEDHFTAGRRQAAFERLVATGESLREFELPREPGLRLDFCGQVERKAMLGLYEEVQELHRTQENIHVSLDVTVPDECIGLFETLPRLRVTRDAVIEAGETPDWRIVDATSTETNGSSRCWSWNGNGEEKRSALSAKADDSSSTGIIGSQGRTLLFYSDEPNPHGVAHYNHAILMALVKDGWTVCSAHPRFESPLLEQQRQAGITHYWTTWNWGPRFANSMVDCAEPERILAAVNPDIVVFSDCWPISNIAAKHQTIKRSVPFLVICHSGDLAPGRQFPNCLKVLAKQFERASEVVAVARSSLEVLRRHYGLPSTKGRVIFNGRPPLYFTPRDEAARARLRDQLGLPAESVLCFTAARFDRAKGYQYQLEAIKQLAAKAANVPLYFAWAGTGHLQGQFEAAIAKAGLERRIRLLGHQWNVSEWLSAADVFVLTTMLEAMPLSVLEAAAKGLPVVATAVGGIPEILGDTGKLLPDPNVDPAGTVNHLAEILLRWAGDPALRERVGRAGKERAERLFREETMVTTTLALINSVRAPHKKPPVAAVA